MVQPPKIQPANAKKQGTGGGDPKIQWTGTESCKNQWSESKNPKNQGTGMINSKNKPTAVDDSQNQPTGIEISKNQPTDTEKSKNQRTMAAISKAKLLALAPPAVPVVGKDRDDASPGKVSLPSAGQDAAALAMIDCESQLSRLEAKST